MATAELIEGMRGSASFDATRRYRYSLLRRWETGEGRLCFCMLNPSTADARGDDPTVRRCVLFAMRWGFAELEVVNIFAWRATDPRELRRLADPIGPRNDAAILRAAGRSRMVVAAWGAWGSLGGRGAAVMRRLTDTTDVRALGWTAGGEPRHPLYTPRDIRPVRAGPACTMA